MKRFAFLSTLLLLILVLACTSGKTNLTEDQNSTGTETKVSTLKVKGQSVTPEAFAALDYPQAERGSQTDEYHGVQVADPYRWLEDVDSEQTLAWVEEQNGVTHQFLDGIESREAIKTRLTELWNYEKFGVPIKRGDRYFFTHNAGLAPQSTIYVQDGPDTERRVLLDPSTLSEDGTVAVSDFYPSPDGKFLALTLAASGSDWNEAKILNVDTGEWTSDHLQWIKFSDISWQPDSSGFFYSRYDQPKESSKLEDLNFFQKLYFHKIGQDQGNDELILERKDQKKWSFDAKASADGRFLVVGVWGGSGKTNLLFAKDFSQPDSNFKEIVTEFEATYLFLGNQESSLYFYSTQDAPLGKILAIDFDNSKPEAWIDVVPQAEENLSEAAWAENSLVLHYLKDATSQISVFSLEGKHLRNLDLPGIGSADKFSGQQEDHELFFRYTGFKTPVSVYRYDFKANVLEVFKSPEVAFQPDLLEAKQVFYPSKDGTLVPMFIVHRKDLKMDGNNPVYLYGYGGFNVSLSPYYSTTNQVWLEMGGIYAMANIRGGGEYGEAWHQAGVKAGRQNSFDDFIGAAEWLIANNYSSPEKMSIGGGSNGGTLVGACMHQRPDLFGAAVPAVGVMDMLRYHKFTIGWAWAEDFGSSDVAEEFPFLNSYSPYHNLKKDVCFPATLITTADHDDRVVPGHSFKFAAALQWAQGCDNPTLIRIESKAGHGAGTPTAKLIENSTDRLAFLARTLGVKYPAE